MNNKSNGKSRFAIFFLIITLFHTSVSTDGLAASLKAVRVELQHDIEHLASGFDGRVGVCVLDSAGSVRINGGQRFSLQSVMKLIVCLAAMDAVDRHQLHLNDAILIQRQNLSLYVQPLANLVGKEGYWTTIGDLVNRAIVDSDSAAADILIGKLGGPREIQAFLDRKGISGVRIDRDERHLQTEIVGLTWHPEYVDPEVLKKAIESVPIRQRTAAYRRYQTDLRDTATPQGMALLLQHLVMGKLISPASTRHILDEMAKTVTFPDRLKAGLPQGWTLMHKTGTSGSWQGITAATNDVGVLRAPNGDLVPVAVFIGDSRATSQVRSALIAKIAAAITAQYR